MSYTIKHLSSAGEKKSFLNFRHRIYSGDPNYVSTAEYVLEMLIFSETHFARECNIMPVCIKNGTDTLAQALFIIAPGTDFVSIGYFDALPGCKDAVEVLLDKARIVSREYNFTRVIVGLCGHLSYGVGILSDGFFKNSFDNLYNPPYYRDFFISADNTYTLTGYSGQISDLYLRINALPSRDITVRNIILADFENECEVFRLLCDGSIGSTRFYYPTSHWHFYDLLKDMRFFLKPENILFAMHGDKPVGFLFWYPDYNDILPAGRQLSDLSVGMRYYFNKSKIRKLKINSLGVLPEYRPFATVALLGELINHSSDFSTVETTFVWDDNSESTALNRYFFDGGSRKFEVYEYNV